MVNQVIITTPEGVPEDLQREFDAFTSKLEQLLETNPELLENPNNVKRLRELTQTGTAEVINDETVQLILDNINQFFPRLETKDICPATKYLLISAIAPVIEFFSEDSGLNKKAIIANVIIGFRGGLGRPSNPNAKLIQETGVVIGALLNKVNHSHLHLLNPEGQDLGNLSQQTYNAMLRHYNEDAPSDEHQAIFAFYFKLINRSSHLAALFANLRQGDITEVNSSIIAKLGFNNRFHEVHPNRIGEQLNALMSTGDENIQSQAQSLRAKSNQVSEQTNQLAEKAKLAWELGAMTNVDYQIPRPTLILPKDSPELALAIIEESLEISLEALAQKATRFEAAINEKTTEIEAKLEDAINKLENDLTAIALQPQEEELAIRQLEQKLGNFVYLLNCIVSDFQTANQNVHAAGKAFSILRIFDLDKLRLEKANAAIGQLATNVEETWNKLINFVPITDKPQHPYIEIGIEKDVKQYPQGSAKAIVLSYLHDTFRAKQKPNEFLEYFTFDDDGNLTGLSQKIDEASIIEKQELLRLLEKLNIDIENLRDGNQGIIDKINSITIGAVPDIEQIFVTAYRKIDHTSSAAPQHRFTELKAQIKQITEALNQLSNNLTNRKLQIYEPNGSYSDSILPLGDYTSLPLTIQNFESLQELDLDNYKDPNNESSPKLLTA